MVSSRKGNEGVIVGWVQPTGLMPIAEGCTHPTSGSLVPACGITHSNTRAASPYQSWSTARTCPEPIQNHSKWKIGSNCDDIQWNVCSQSSDKRHFPPCAVQFRAFSQYVGRTRNARLKPAIPGRCVV